MADHPHVPDNFSRRVPDGDNRPRLICDSCGFVSYENPKVVVGSVCSVGDRILLCRRAIMPRLGYWTLPAGYLKTHETTADGAMREAMEEACARIEIDALLAVYNVPRSARCRSSTALGCSATSPPGRRVRRSACFAGTRSRGTISRFPACAGRCITIAGARPSRVLGPHQSARRARRLLNLRCLVSSPSPSLAGRTFRRATARQGLATE